MPTGIYYNDLPKEYPHTTFFFKNGKYCLEYNSKNGYLWCRYEYVWSVFEREYNMKYNDIQSTIKKLVEDHFKCKGVTPYPHCGPMLLKVEDHFKCKGVTPKLID